MNLPPELVYKIFEHMEDKSAIDDALASVPDIVYDTVRHIRSPRVVEVPREYLMPFKRLVHTTNIMVRVTQRQIHRLRHLSRLRSLCIEVVDATNSDYCITQLVQLFHMEDKRDDQLWIIRVFNRPKPRPPAPSIPDPPILPRVVCIRNSLWLANTSDLTPPGFLYGNIHLLHPRPYYDFLRAALPYADDRLARVLDVLLKYKYTHVDLDYEIVQSIRYAIGKDKAIVSESFMRDAGLRSFARSVEKAQFFSWRLVHYFDIPDTPPAFPEAELRIVEEYIRDARYYDSEASDTEGASGSDTEGSVDSDTEGASGSDTEGSVDSDRTDH